MITYDVTYSDKGGKKQDFVVDAESPGKAIENVHYFCSDCRRVVKVVPRPMFSDKCSKHKLKWKLLQFPHHSFALS